MHRKTRLAETLTRLADERPVFGLGRDRKQWGARRFLSEGIVLKSSKYEAICCCERC